MSAQPFIERRRAPRDRAEVKRALAEMRAERASLWTRSGPVHAILDAAIERAEADLVELDRIQGTVASGIRRICRALAGGAPGARDRRAADHAGTPTAPRRSGGL